MKKARMLFFAIAVCMMFSTTSFAINADEDLSLPESKAINSLIPVYWKAMDVLAQIESTEYSDKDLAREYKKLMNKIETECNRMASDICYSLENGDTKPLENFSAVYKCKKHFERIPLFMICKPVISKVKAMAVEGNNTLAANGIETFMAEYFPGYGYAEPGFKYRRGKEINSEFLHAYWQDEEKIIETAMHFEGTIDFKIAAELKASPLVKNYKETSEPFKMDIGGHLVLCIKVSFDSSMKLTTRAKKKYQATKVWFELMRKPSSIFNNTAWEVCGKTYEMKEFFTNQEVIQEVKAGK